MPKIKTAIGFHVSTNQDIAPHQIATLIGKVIDIGLADAAETASSGEGNVAEADLVTSLTIGTPVVMISAATSPIRVFADSETGRSWVVRVIYQGQGHGRNDAFIHDKEEPIVEFFDPRSELTPLGQFVSSYYRSTLLERDYGGLCLDGGVPNWVVQDRCMNRIRGWLASLNENGQVLPLQVLSSANGFFIGTTDCGYPNSRESEEYWPTKEAAAQSLKDGTWTRRKAV